MWCVHCTAAFFRGVWYCSWYWNEKYGYNDACPRTYLAWLTLRVGGCVMQADGGTA